MINDTDIAKDNLFNNLIDQLSFNPEYNLELIAKYISGKANASGCLIVSEGNIIATDGGLLSSPADATDCILVEMNDPDGRIKDDRRIKRDKYANMKGYVYLLRKDAETSKGKKQVEKTYEIPGECDSLSLANLIGNNIELYQTQLVASTDKLTGSLNRKYLDIAIERELGNAKAKNEPLTVIMCDLDFFKHINDTYGHPQGDAILLDISNILKKEMGKNGILGRYGGEEFIVLLSNTGCEAAAVVAERLRLAVYDAKLLGTRRDVTVSLGIASYPRHAATRTALINKADKALYMAKNNGRNRYEVWNDSFNDTVVAKNNAYEFITGDIVKDATRMLVLFEILELSKKSLPAAKKIDAALHKIREESGAASATLLLVNDSKITEAFEVSHKSYNTWFNQKVIDEVIQTKNAVFMVDWDNDAPDASGLTDWQSLAVVPVLKNDMVKAVLYLNVSVKIKEFENDSAGFLYKAGTLMSAIL